jgi:predicted N-formylglutamate amidohydrolase
MDGVRTVARPISPTVDAALLMAGVDRLLSDALMTLQ